MEKAENKYLHEGSDYILSYAKISGKKPVDVLGYVSLEFDEPVFKISRILFDDGSEQYVEGEHDLPYMTDESEESTKVLEAIAEEDRKEDEQ